LIARDQYDEAEKIVNDLPRHPASASIFNVLGVIHARRGEWPPAIRNFMRVIELLPKEHEAYHSVAPLLAQSGDHEAYRALCSQIIRQFGNTSNPMVAERMAKDCLILPSRSNERDKVAKMVGTAVAAGPTHKFWDYIQFVKALADYRDGNFANADMVGHSGKLAPTIKGVETVDACLGRIYQSISQQGGSLLITADHGNAEMMVDPVTGGPHTAHTTNPVPFILVSEDAKKFSLKPDGSLRDISPTLLSLLGLAQPNQMTGGDLRQLLG